MTTRRTHTVRIKNPNQNGAYVDVQVLDAITFTGPNNFQMSFSVPAQGGDISVAIVDNTGDGNSKGNLANCTRASHMVRLTSQSDDTQVLDVEVCDAFASAAILDSWLWSRHGPCMLSNCKASSQTALTTRTKTIFC